MPSVWFDRGVSSSCAYFVRGGLRHLVTPLQHFWQHIINQGTGGREQKMEDYMGGSSLGVMKLEE